MEDSALAPTRMRKQQVKQTSKTTWTAEEDELLSKLVSQSQQANSWSVIAKYFPNKTAPQIAGRWEKVLNPCLVKGSWTREEDQVILNFVQTNGDKDWAKLALLLNGRTGKQCRERFKNHLDPNLVRNPWTPEEDQHLIDLHSQYGNQWTKISSFFSSITEKFSDTFRINLLDLINDPIISKTFLISKISSFFEGRTDNCIKNRWNSTLKKRLERIEKGEPLVQKRGRKPKNYYCSLPKPNIDENTFADSHDNSEACSSPVVPRIGTTQVIQMMPLALDQISLIRPRKETSFKISSLEENRLDLKRMLSAID
ncbi:Myb-like DNA-binding domain containing protein [Tritrichomonas foetus]|uniref:Myb-like DNA-binding domain containing protein n=1 Tax=Tritrichomonas foetus TaxID=1144522 RepID=A0A1J4KZG6_9EUKA|nr:Myb-like DNA-binding domain containing protein [Tritrichomonas foetus]|eukprot:OHT16643.1 Myb-like DNA-binding domain containing protein [Tritrichomonas foetus]